MIRLFACLALSGLAACGADGEPNPPASTVPVVTSQLSVTSSGTDASVAMTASRGPVAIQIGI